MGRATAGASQIYCVMCPERSFAERECNGVRSDSEASHFFYPYYSFAERFFHYFENLIFFVFLFPRGVRGELEKEKHLIAASFSNHFLLICFFDKVYYFVLHINNLHWFK